jgi:hypothetical protein
MTELMHTRLDERDPSVGAVEAPSPFRSAFTRARVEARGAGGLGAGDAPSATAPLSGREPEEEQPAAAAGATRARAVRFEVRIEKRRGRRADEARWGKLGLDGWELVSVVGKRAFFRRRHRNG